MDEDSPSAFRDHPDLTGGGAVRPSSEPIARGCRQSGDRPRTSHARDRMIPFCHSNAASRSNETGPSEPDLMIMPADRPPPPVETTATAIDAVARTLFGEGRAEPPDMRIAVAEVIYNRAIKRLPRFGTTVEAVCRNPEQFTCWNPGNPNRRHLLSLPPTAPELAGCLAIAENLVAGAVGDLTRGADHYHHRRIFPFYSRGRIPCAQIGNYLFFNDID
ncbi:MAG: cell wall hydrolase [Thalassobaculaceae bacterium]